MVEGFGILEEIMERELARRYTESFLANSVVFVDSLFQYFAVFGPVAENGPGDFAVLVRGEGFPRANRESAVAVQKQRIECLGEFAAHR